MIEILMENEGNLAFYVIKCNSITTTKKIANTERAFCVKF